MLIFSNGSTITDIDAIASCLCYGEHLQLLGYEVCFNLSEIRNFSIPADLLSASHEALKKFSNENLDSNDGHRYILINTSDPQNLNENIAIDTVVGVLDHHLGFEDFWKEKIGEQAQILNTQSTAAIVWQAIREKGHDHKISKTWLTLLAQAIVYKTYGLLDGFASKMDLEAFQQIAECLCIPTEDLVNSYLKTHTKQNLSNLPDSLMLEAKDLQSKWGFIRFFQIMADDELPVEKELIELCQSPIFSEKDGESNPQYWIIAVIFPISGTSTVYTNHKLLAERLSLFNEPVCPSATTEPTDGVNKVVFPKVYIRSQILKNWT